MKKPTFVILTIFFVLLMMFLSRFLFIGQAVYGDGIFYWSYVRSIVIDHDLNLGNEAVHPYSPEQNNTLTDSSTVGSSLIYKKYYPIGTSLTWLPAFLIGHTVAPIFSYPQNGYSDSYQVTVGVVNIMFVMFGLMLVFTVLRQFYTQFVSLFTVVLLVFSTNLLYYGSLDVLNSHPSSFLISSLFLYILFSPQTIKSQKYIFLLGCLVGLLALIRPQDLLFAIVCIPFLMKTSFRETISKSVIFGAGILLLYSPQLLASWYLYQSPFVLPYLTGTNTFDPFNPHLLELFLSPKTGFLFYAPLFLIAGFGLILYARSKLPFRLMIPLLLGLEVYLVSIWSGWEQGESFGMRMFISLLPFLSLGLSEVVRRLTGFFSKPAIIGFGLVFIFQNLLMIFLFHLFLHEATYIGAELSRGSEIRIMLLEALSRFVN